jgi:hypothetical protein
MFVDAMLLVSDAQALTVTAFSTNTIDLGNPSVKNRIGSGQPMAAAIQVDVAADFTTGDETYIFQVVESANANLSTPTIIAQQPVLAALLKAGAKFAIPIPPGYPRARYLGMQYTLAGTTPTCTVTVEFAPMSMIDSEWTIYAKGYNV